jgi:hypothetical protein
MHQPVGSGGFQFGAFSDHFVFSVPDWFGGRILTKASQLIIDLLRAEFLIRGAVVLGPLYHCDNVIFGPALLRAVDIENNETFYPRILVSDAVVDHCSRLGHDLQCSLMIRDRTGRLVINPFAVPFEAPDEAIESVARLNFFLPEIKPIIVRKLIDLENEGRHRHAEKWRYLDNLSRGRCLTQHRSCELFGSRRRSAAAWAWSENETEMLALVCRRWRGPATYLVAVRRGLVSARWSAKLPESRDLVLDRRGSRPPRLEVARLGRCHSDRNWVFA